MTAIASLVLRVKPLKLAAVREALSQMAGVSIHGATDDGRLAVVIEDAEGMPASHAYRALSEIDGVVSSLLAYQYSDDPLPQELST